MACPTVCESWNFFAYADIGEITIQIVTSQVPSFSCVSPVDHRVGFEVAGRAPRVLLITEGPLAVWPVPGRPLCPVTEPPLR